MRMGIHKQALAGALSRADYVFIYQPADLEWDTGGLQNEGAQELAIHSDIDKLAEDIIAISQPADSILIMSNGGFAGIHEKILQGLQHKYATS